MYHYDTNKKRNANICCFLLLITNNYCNIIIYNNTEIFEKASKLDVICFDKTGTLTNGTPKVVNIISENKKETLHLLASLESKSEHPLAKAIVNYYNNAKLADVKDFKMHIGKGVSGTINNSKIIAGNKKFLESENIPLKYDNNEKTGEISIFIAKNNEVIGKVVLADTLRRNSKQTIQMLKRLRVRTTLLTGDSLETAKYVADQLKIRNIKSNCLPEDKTNYIKQEQIKGNRVAMIGDGINDAPSLKKANVGIAMGSVGSEISIESANIALINDNIEDIPHLIAMAKKTIKTINY